jgi:hypothetical protein
MNLNLHTITESPALTQYPVHNIVKLFGETGPSVLKESQKLHKGGVTNPQVASKLISQE